MIRGAIFLCGTLDHSFIFSFFFFQQVAFVVVLSCEK